MKHITTFFILSLLSTGLWAQPSVLYTCCGATTPAPTNSRYAMTAVGIFKQVRFQANHSSAASTETWAFSSGTPGTPDYNPCWRPSTGGNTMSVNNYIPVSYANGAVYQASSGGADGLLPAITSGNYYTFNVSNNSTSSNTMSLLETTYNPVMITSVVQSPATSTVVYSNSVTVTITLSAAPSAGENVFLRYTSNAYTNSNLVPFSFSGTTGTAVIPAQLLASTISYYVYSSNKSLTAINSDVSSYGQSAHDMATLNLNNNSNSNYGYTTVCNPAAVSILASGVTNFCSPGVVNLTATPASSGNALTLSGNYINLSSNTGLLAFPQSAYTIETWVNPTSTAGNQALLYNGLCNNSCATYGLSIGGLNPCSGSGTAGKYNFEFYNNVGGAFNLVSVSPVLANTWTHIAVTYDGSSMLSMYINGVLDNTLTVSGTPSTPGAYLFIGQDPTLAGCGLARYQFDGALDEFRIWNTARSGVQIAANYNTIVASNTTNLILDYNMDAISGTTVKDTTTNAYNGIITNGTPAWALSTAFGFSAYSWSTGTTASSITASASTTCSVSVTAANGCTATASQVVAVNPIPVVVITGASTACGSVSLVASGGTIYAWSGGTTPTTAANTFTTSGTYSVTVTNAATCTASASISVTVLTALSATVSTVNPTCLATGSINITNPQGPANIGLLSTNFSTTPTGATLSGTAVVSGGECVLTTPTINTQGFIKFPATTITPDLINASFDFRSADGTGADGISFNYGVINGGATYYETGILSAGLAVGLIEFAGPRVAIYYNTVLLTSFSTVISSTSYRNCTIAVDALGRISVSIAGAAVVTNYALPAAYLTANKSSWLFAIAARCGGLSNKHSIDNVSIGYTPTPQYSINGTTWQTAASFAVPAGTYTVLERLDNGTVCGSTTIGSPTLTPAVTVAASISGTSTACATVSLTASGGTVYAWSGGASPSTATNTFTASGVYQVTVTNAGGCSATASQAITVTPAPTVTITGTPAACTTVSLTASGGIAYLWSGGSATTSATNTFSVSGTYTVTATAANACTASASQIVVVKKFSIAATSTTANPDHGCSATVSLAATGYTAGTNAVLIWYTGTGGTGINKGTGTPLAIASPTGITTYYARLAGDCNTVETNVTVTTGGSFNLELATASVPTAQTICQAGVWSYYENPADPGKYVFAINWDPSGDGLGTNSTAAKAAAVVSIGVNGNYYSATSLVNGGPQGTWAMKRFWNINDGGLPLDAEGVNIRFYYDPTEKTAIETAAQTWATANGSTYEGFLWFKTVGIAYDPTTQINYLGVAQGSSIPLMPATVGTENSITYAEFDNVSGFSGGTGVAGVGSGNPLPLTLLAFHGINEGKTNHLFWATGTEQDLSRFDIMRSTDGIHFAKIGQTEAAGSSVVRHDYQFVDRHPITGDDYYQLMPTDNDGTTHPTDIIALSMLPDKPTITNVYPNPAYTTVTIEMYSPGTEHVNSKLIDNLGRVVSEFSMDLTEGNNQQSMDVSALNPGVYYLHFTCCGGEVFVHKMVKGRE